MQTATQNGRYAVTQTTSLTVTRTRQGLSSTRSKQHDLPTNQHQVRDRGEES